MLAEHLKLQGLSCKLAQCSLLHALLLFHCFYISAGSSQGFAEYFPVASKIGRGGEAGHLGLGSPARMSQSVIM